MIPVLRPGTAVRRYIFITSVSLVAERALRGAECNRRSTARGDWWADLDEWTMRTGLD